MASPIAKFGAKLKPFGLYQPTEEELAQLFSQLEEITGAEINDESRINIKRCIILARHQIDASNETPDKGELEQELEAVKNAVLKVNDILNKRKISDKLRHIIEPLQITNGLVKDGGTLYALGTSSYDFAEVLLPALEAHIQGMGSSAYINTKIRDEVSIDFAKALHRSGIKISSTIEGVFSKCLETFLNSIKFSIENREVSVHIPEDMHMLVMSTVQAYPNAPDKELLSSSAKFPGL